MCTVALFMILKKKKEIKKKETQKQHKSLLKTE